MSRTRLALITMALLFASPAMAADAGAFAKACKDDIQKHCAGVKPGGGRVGRCLHEKKDRVSAACGQALTKVLIETFQKACGEDVRKHCGQVAPGGGRVLACLKGKQKELTSACKTLVDQAGG